MSASVLVDSFGRRHDYLRISVTDRCNLRCIYCMPEEGLEFEPSAHILSYEEIAEVVRVLAGMGVRKLRLTGGEPLVRKELDVLVAMLSRIPGIEDISLTTNGIFLAPKAERLKQAGLTRVNISLDSLKPDRFKMITRGGDVDKVLNSIAACVAAGLSPVKLNVVLMKGINEDEIADFLRLTMEQASAGGGGIGMQIVDNESEMKQAFEGNQKRASDFFGDGAMYIEKVVANPRHIEIQILADSYGNTVHLGERECSIQRRHQKVVEEAPSSYLDELTRSKMGEAAVRAAQSIGYRNAGTIEFLVDGDKNFYFLEMNTRLQVEHTITEEITGLDLVAEQLRIAAGHSLNFGQSDVTRDGHAIEVRIYAEDPKTFFPSPGVITKFAIPEGDGIRHELAVHDGSMVTPFYDPMIAKLIVKGKDRDEAIDRLQQALADYQVEGIKTNIPMLQEVIAHPAFRSGDTTTSFVAKYVLEKT
ncbi:radical SAM protein [Paenibacillus thiaminolyticus]|uniref:ATP-binding protein n=1 Tax=Paenibacillus thiaminolyticus TaxID=49283 RepID=UPI0035A60137